MLPPVEPKSASGCEWWLLSRLRRRIFLLLMIVGIGVYAVTEILAFVELSDTTTESVPIQGSEYASLMFRFHVVNIGTKCESSVAPQ